MAMPGESMKSTQQDLRLHRFQDERTLENRLVCTRDLAKEFHHEALPFVKAKDRQL